MKRWDFNSQAATHEVAASVAQKVSAGLFPIRSWEV